MNNDSKVKNVARNTVMGVLNNVALVALNLISRKLFLNYIGIEYLSIGQVINNILGVLAFSELGVTNSVLYMLYKPVAEGNNEKTSRIIGSYKKLNRVIGCVIFVLGLICMPFLNKFIDTSVDIRIVYLIFLLNLFNSANTYFLSYRQVLINANQKNYIISRVSLAINFISIIVQCGVILLKHNYIMYLMVTIVMGIIQNVIIYNKAGKMFPFLNKYKDYRLVKEDSKELFDNVKSMFSVKICGIVINNTDNILVSLINTSMVGYCANYTIISTRIRGIITIFHNSTVYSLGIASVEKNAQEKYELFKKFLMINTFLGGFTATLLGVLWDDFVILWIGEEYLISPLIMYSILLNYLTTIITSGIWIFRDTNGLFKHVKNMLVINAVLNLVISIILGKLIGIAGVYLGTVISDILTDFWYDSKLVYKNLFDRNDYWRYMAFIVANVCIVISMIYVIKIAAQPFPVTIILWLIKAAVTGLIYAALFCALYGRTPVFKSVVNSYIKPRFSRRHN